MPRRKTLIDDLFDALSKLSVIYVIFLALFWWSNKPLFWKTLWWGVAFLAIFILTAVLIKRFKIHKRDQKQGQWQSDKDLLYWLKGMKPWELEHYIADLFTRLGFKTQAIGKSYDGGIDVIAEKDGIKHYIQCKKYITSKVGVREIREFYGSITDKLAKGKAYFITTNIFTLEAERFAEDKPIELVDGDRLIRYIRLVGKNKRV